MTSHEETQSEKKQKKKNGKVLLHDEKHTQLFSHHDIKTVKKNPKKIKCNCSLVTYEPAIFHALTENSAFAYDTTLWKQIMLFSAPEFSVS